VIPEEPNRIVALSVQDADIVVALGVLPVAMTRYRYGTDDGRTPWLASKPGVASVELLDEDDGGAVSLEKVAALNPDLILAGQYLGTDAQYDKLARIAPVIARQQKRLTGSWQEQTIVIGRALGREEQARRVVSEVETKISEMRRDHPEFEGKTASCSIHVEPDAIRTSNSTRDYAAKLLSDLGLSLPPGVTTLQGGDGARIGLEQLGTLDADVLIMSYASDDLRASLESNPVFQAVPAVRDRRYLPTGLDATSALRLPSVLSIPYGLDQLEPALAKALG
jgi:iron complex transport system substrate-binding protein